MDLTNAKNVKLSEAEVIRALTNPSTTPFTVYDVEELERNTLITTPQFTPMLDLLRGTAKRSQSLKFEWNEKTTNTTHTNSAYDGNTPPSDRAGTPTRNDNYIMPLAQVAKVSRFAESFTTTDDGDATGIEMEEKLIDVKKSMEYFIWNGTRATTSPAIQTDGIKTLVTTSVSNADGGGLSQPLQEPILRATLARIYAEGAIPKIIACTPIQAERIANFTRNNDAVRPRPDINGTGAEAFTYRSPFGFNVLVVPVLEEFIGVSGDIYVLSTDVIRLRFSGKSLLNSEAIGITTHGMATIIYSFMGLELKGATKFHRKITFVDNSL